MAENFMARKDGKWLVVCMAPDVCKTPMGSATPPVPYPVTAQLVTSKGVAKTVRANGQPAVVFDKSLTPTTIGDMAGVANGVKSGTVAGECFPKGKSNTVFAEGKCIVRHDDEFYMNGKF